MGRSTQNWCPFFCLCCPTFLRRGFSWCQVLSQHSSGVTAAASKVPLSSPWGCSARFLFGGPLQACRRERLATRSPGGSTPSGGSHTLVDAHISGIVLESLEGPLLGRCLASCAITDSFANRVVKPRSQCQTAAFLSQTLSSHCSGSLNVWRVTKWVTLGASMSSRR